MATNEGSSAARAGDGDDRSIPALWVAFSNLDQKFEARFETMMNSLQQVMVQLGVDDHHPRREPLAPMMREEAQTPPPPPSRQEFQLRRNQLPGDAPIGIHDGEFRPPPRPLAPIYDSDDGEGMWVNRGPRFGRRNNRYVDEGGSDFKFKIDIPGFDGHLNIKDYLDWERAVENFFDYMNMPEEKQAKLVAYKLSGDASA